MSSSEEKDYKYYLEQGLLFLQNQDYDLILIKFGMKLWGLTWIKKNQKMIIPLKKE